MAPKGPVEELVRDYSRARILLRDKEYESAVQLFDAIRTRLDGDSHVGEDIRLTRMVDCGFQMCKAYDRMGDYDSAWAAATRCSLQLARWRRWKCGNFARFCAQSPS